MKKLLILSTSLLLMFSCFAQRNTRSTRTFEDYMAKSHKRTVAAWVFIGSGAAITAVGTALVIDGSKGNDDDYGYGFTTNDEGKILGGAVMITGGILLMCTSIPFFIMAHHYKKKAMNLAFKPEKIQLPRLGKSGYQYYPALTLKVNIGR